MNDLVCKEHHYNGSFIQETCPICKVEREQQLQLLLNAVKAAKELRDAHDAMFRALKANRFNLPQGLMGDFATEIQAAGVGEGFRERFDDAVKALEGK